MSVKHEICRRVITLMRASHCVSEWFPGSSDGRPGFHSWVGKIRWRRERQPTLVFLDIHCGSAGKESACNAGDLGSNPGLGRSPGEGKGYPLQCSGLENSVVCIVHRVAKSGTWLKDFHFPVLPGEFHEQRRLDGYSPQVKESHKADRLTLTFVTCLSPQALVHKRLHNISNYITMWVLYTNKLPLDSISIDYLPHLYT